jgi:5'-nucleotidase
MERRKFIQNTGLVLGGLAIAPNLIAAPNLKRTTKITILHTNDTHSNIDAFSINHAKYPGLGGVSRRFELVKEIRQQEEHVLLLDAGDIFQGTPYFNRFGGVLELKLMSALKYDGATMGNHDFDGGMDGFLKAKAHADFPFICSNYDFKNTILDGQTANLHVFQKGSVKIGVFGLGIETKGLIPDALCKEVVYLDPIEIAQDQVRELQALGADLIICLSHLGYSYESQKISDRKLAKQTEGIHLIIGGHTHTFLEKPTVELNLKGQPTLINQVGWAGVQLGRIDFYVGKNFKNESQLIIID